MHIQGGYFNWPPLKVLSTRKLIQARLGVSRTIYVDVDTPNLGFTYFNFFFGGGALCTIILSAIVEYGKASLKPIYFCCRCRQTKMIKCNQDRFDASGRQISTSNQIQRAKASHARIMRENAKESLD